jgi:hypothetical protein
VARVRKVFISYRRQDAGHPAGRIREWFIQSWRIPASSVFMDVANIDGGDDFEQAIKKAIDQCGAMIILISPSWLADVNRPDISYPRMEAEAALRSNRLKVIPVRVDDTGLPTKHQLPQSLHDLLKLNILPLRAASFDYDIGLVGKALGWRARRRVLIGSLLTFLLVVGGSLATLSQVPRGNPIWNLAHGASPTPSPSDTNTSGTTPGEIRLGTPGSSDTNTSSTTPGQTTPVTLPPITIFDRPRPSCNEADSRVSWTVVNGKTECQPTVLRLIGTKNNPATPDTETAELRLALNSNSLPTRYTVSFRVVITGNLGIPVSSNSDPGECTGVRVHDTPDGSTFDVAELCTAGGVVSGMSTYRIRNHVFYGDRVMASVQSDHVTSTTVEFDVTVTVGPDAVVFLVNDKTVTLSPVVGPGTAFLELDLAGPAEWNPWADFSNFHYSGA